MIPSAVSSPFGGEESRREEERGKGVQKNDVVLVRVDLFAQADHRAASRNDHGSE